MVVRLDEQTSFCVLLGVSGVAGLGSDLVAIRCNQIEGSVIGLRNTSLILGWLTLKSGF